MPPSPESPSDHLESSATADADPVAGRMRRRLAALGIVGALMVALPLVQVLRYQSAELDTLAGQRAGLDPVGRAVDVQRGLLAHGEVAARVLQGGSAQEPERRLRQREVDDRVGTLSATLQGGRWVQAARENDAMREDWSLLASRLAQHTVDAEESQQAHRLLVEQVLQIIDLLADALAPLAAHLGRTDPAASRSDVFFSSYAVSASDRDAGALDAARALPRLIAQMADAPTSQRALAAAEADLARLHGALNAEFVKPGAAGHRLLAGAAAAAGAAADRYFLLLRQDAPAAEVQAARATALSMQFRMFDLSLTNVDAYLSIQMAAIAQLRLLWCVALGTLALLAATLAVPLALGLRRARRVAAPGAPAPMEAPGTPDASMRAYAERRVGKQLLDRLRAGDVNAPSTPGTAAAAPGRNAAEPTLPPDV